MAKVLNCANTPVDKAIAYAQGQCSADGKSMAEYFSDFKTNYLLLQEKCDLALDLPRIEMPVIEPEQMDEFQESLSKGHIDVKEPVAKSPQPKNKYPTNLGFDLRGRQWLYRGTRDGSIKDDILDTQMTEIAVADLKPSQSQIWLEKVVGMSLYFGPLKQSSEFLHEAPIIVSSDGYILDGHHRFGAAMVSNPSLRLTALKVDMEIRELVKMARSYGNAIGNEQKAAESFEAEMDKVVDVDCVNIVSKKSAFTGKDRNFYRVSFRDSGQYDRFGIPAWASKAAKTMGEKYYGVSGCQMVMGMLPSGKWQIQAILIPNTEKMNKQKALKIANHMQDRIEKEGKWAKKKCREDEIIQIYQADEYGAETFDADEAEMSEIKNKARYEKIVNYMEKLGFTMKPYDVSFGSYGYIQFDPPFYVKAPNEEQVKCQLFYNFASDEFFVEGYYYNNLDYDENDVPTGIPTIKTMKDKLNTYGFHNLYFDDWNDINTLLYILDWDDEKGTSEKSCSHDNLSIKTMEQLDGELLLTLDCANCGKRTSTSASLNQGWDAETFNAMSFNQWSQDEMNEELHGGRNMQFKEWLDDEVHTHGNIPLKEWGYEEEHDEPEHQHAETFNAERTLKGVQITRKNKNRSTLTYRDVDGILYKTNKEWILKIDSRNIKTDVGSFAKGLEAFKRHIDMNSSNIGYDAESMMKTYKVQVKRIEGGDSQIVEIEVESDESDMESLMDEIEIAVANELQTWDFGGLTVVSGPHYQMAESFNADEEEQRFYDELPQRIEEKRKEIADLDRRMAHADTDRREMKKMYSQMVILEGELFNLHQMLNPHYQMAETLNADVDTETKDYWYDNIKYSWEGYGLERYQNAKLNRSMKSCVKDWLADNPNELAYMVQDNHEINEEAMDGDYKIPSKQMMKKEVAYLKSVFRKVADEMDKNGEWDRHSHKVNFDAESMVRKPAYGLFGLSFITGILLNMARKD